MEVEGSVAAGGGDGEAGSYGYEDADMALEEGEEQLREGGEEAGPAFKLLIPTESLTALPPAAAARLPLPLPMPLLPPPKAQHAERGVDYFDPSTALVPWKPAGDVLWRAAQQQGAGLLQARAGRGLRMEGGGGGGEAEMMGEEGVGAWQGSSEAYGAADADIDAMLEG